MSGRLFAAAVVFAAIMPAVVETGDHQPRTISGQVEVEDNGRRVPVRRVAVTISSDTAKVAQTTFTDSDGRYHFLSVSAGRYRVEAAKPGFLQLQPAVAGAADGIVNIEMQRAAALEGRFIEDSGKPIAGLVVRAESIAQAASFTATTDDLGRFRIHTVPPGQYRVHATPPVPASGAKHFYPGTENVGDATIVTVVSGQTRDGIMVVVPMPPLSAVAAEIRTGQELDALEAPTGGGKWGQLSGRVTRSDSGQPIVNAEVRLATSAGAVLRRAWTDGDGGYLLNRVVPGTYQVTVAADGHVTHSGTAPTGSAQAVPRTTFGDGEKVKRNFALVPLSAIEGRVTDAFGDGVPGVALRITQRTVGTDGQFRFMPVLSGSIPPLTDDRGSYRSPNLTPGEYFVFALPPPFEPPRITPGPAPFAVTYFPGTRSGSAATAVTIQAGIDAYGVDFPLPPVRTTTVSGIAADPDGGIRPGGISLLPVDDGKVRFPAPATAVMDAAGRFTFRDVPEGDYVLQAGSGAMYGAMLVSVTASSGPELKVRFTLQPLGTVRGQVSFEGELPPQRVLSLLRVRIQPSEMTLAPLGGTTERAASINKDQTFTLMNVAWPGFLRVFPTELDGWAFSRVLFQGRDITDTPYEFQTGVTDGIEVVMTKRVGGIKGTVVAGDDTVAGVFLMGADSESPEYLSRTFRSAHLTQTGEFRVGGLRPGRYFVVAAGRGVITGSNPLPTLRSRGTLVVVSEGVDTEVRLTVVK